MLAYLAILGACIAGYAGVGPWAIAAAAIALTSLSYSEHYDTYQRGRALGLLNIVDTALVRSLLNSVITAGLAFGFGLLLQWF